MAKAAKRTAKNQVRQKALDINYKISPDVHLLYADQTVIQYYADEFVISFFQTEHPLVFSEEDFERRGSIDARCIARFALNPNQMGRFVVAINQNFQKWREQTEQTVREARNKEEKGAKAK
jgi:hypothetical protein